MERPLLIFRCGRGRVRFVYIFLSYSLSVKLKAVLLQAI